MGIGPCNGHGRHGALRLPATSGLAATGRGRGEIVGLPNEVRRQAREKEGSEKRLLEAASSIHENALSIRHSKAFSPNRRGIEFIIFSSFIITARGASSLWITFIAP